MKIHFVLVEPSVPENIGAAARAMKTMGFDSLILVNPPSYPQEKMFHVAYGSRDIIENAIIADNLKEIISSMDFSIATTARRRSVKHNYHHAGDIPSILAAKKRSLSNIAILFGREESGLTNQEIAMCDIVSSVPLKKRYPSLNLAQAVMIYAYLLSEYSQVRSSKSHITPIGKFRKMKMMAEEVLLEISISRNKNLHNRMLERLSLLDDRDVNLVLSFLDKLKKRSFRNQS